VPANAQGECGEDQVAGYSNNVRSIKKVPGDAFSSPATAIRLKSAARDEERLLGAAKT
jgi:hypothetical protein